jgi:cytochrome c-type biogenesis protein CcmF
MNEIQYLNEHPIPGMLGNFFVVLSFVSAIFATVAYYLSTRSAGIEDVWKKPARWAFYVHGISVIGVVGTLLFMLTNHLYEYKYVWEHLNNEMPMQYVFSCMWEGQEGSFLLWTFWHVILGFFLIKWSKDWEPWVMAIVALVEVFLASMLLGVFFGEFQFGSNPFMLNREAGMNVGLPWTMNEDYLSLPTFQNGRGLNPLLQNYWMTIHPPTLFLGFASTLIPFAFAIAGLWRGDKSGWIKPAIPWAFFGVMILGTGILMGGAWAYEALGFGGFWAWDPVENASLVPWLTLVGAAHLLVINQRKQTSVFSALILTISSFILVLYSTFLTRSGVLGDSSVHSFVDSGILAQLLVYLLFFTALSTWLMNSDKKWRTIYLAACGILFLLGIANLMTLPDAPPVEGALPGAGTWIPTLTLVFMLLSLVAVYISYRKEYRVAAEQEEALWSREFWMFIGSLVLTLAAIHVTVQTSVNVGNILLAPFEDTFKSLHASTDWGWAKRLSEHNFAAPAEKERFDTYHRIQIPLAFILFLIIAIGQFLKYKSTDLKYFLKKISLSLIASFVLTVILGFFIQFESNSGPLYALIFATFFALISNADYAIRILKGKMDLIGASVAHIGFALLIIGAVISTSQSFFISENKRGNVTELSEDFDNSEDMLIYKGDTLVMGEYFVHFKDKYKSGNRLYCTIDYLKKLPKEYKAGQYVEVQGSTFRSLKDHTASESFLRDWSQDSLWKEVTPAEFGEEEAPEWVAGVPGEKLFTLEPTLLFAKDQTSREPSIKHSLTSDLYTYIKYTDTEMKGDSAGYLEPKAGIVPVGQPVRLSETVTIQLDSMVAITDLPENLPDNVKLKRAFGVMTDGQSTERIILASVQMEDGTPLVFPVESQKFKMLLSLKETKDGVELTMQQHSSGVKDMLILSAEIFPQINVLWLGCLVMVIGTTMAIRHRIRLSKNKVNA